MLKQIEMKHTLYDCVEEMLKPETLSILLGKRITKVIIRSIPFDGHNGHSGSSMSYVETDDGRFYMKQMNLDIDYIMKATDDTQCRQVTLWQHGILDELKPEINHGVIAVARDADGWAVLMHDLSDGLFSEDRHPFTDNMFWLYLDRMAYMHATFWDDPRLDNPALGLMTRHKFSSCFSIENIASLDAYSTSPLHEWMTNGWKAFSQLVSEDVYLQIRDLANNPQPVIDAAALYPRTLVHGDYREDNFAFFSSTKLTIFDWQFSSYTLMTADLMGKLLHLPISNHDAIKTYYRGRLQHYLGIVFDHDDWNKMVDLGLCLYALQRICVISYITTFDDEAFEYFSPRVTHMARWILDVQKWL